MKIPRALTEQETIKELERRLANQKEKTSLFARLLHGCVDVLGKIANSKETPSTEEMHKPEQIAARHIDYLVIELTKAKKELVDNV